MEFYVDNVGAQYTIDKKKLIKLPSNIEEYELVEGCKSFDNKAFEGCINLKTLILPYTFNVLYDGCFDNCPTLSKIIAYSENLSCVEKLSEYWVNMKMSEFFRKYSHISELYVLPWTHAYKHFTNSLITKIVTTRAYAIDYNDNKVGINCIDSCIFNRKKDILLKDNNKGKYITIGEGVKRIYKDAYVDNPDIKELTLPSTIEEIDYDAFQHCNELEKIIIHAEHYPCIDFIAPNIKKVYVPIGLKDKYESFKGKFKKYEIEELSLCSNDSFVNSDNCIYTKDKSRLISGENCTKRSPSILPETKEISPKAFFNNVYIEELKIPYNVNSIGEGAFEGCINLRRLVENTSINFQYEGNNIFKGCENLTEFYVNVSRANHLKQKGFTDVYDLPTYYFDDIWIDHETHIIYNTTKNKLIHLPSKIADNLSSFTIPENVEEIFVHAFSSCKNIKSIKLSSNIKNLSGAPFCTCNELEYIDTSNNQHFINVDGIIFTSDKKKIIVCPHKKSIKLYRTPCDVEEIADYAFAVHKELSIIKLSENLKIIGVGAFTLTNLNRVIIPSKVEIIGKEAFKGCPLQNVVFTGTAIRKVEEFAFLIDFNKINAFDFKTLIPVQSNSNLKKLKEIRMIQEMNSDEILRKKQLFDNYFDEIEIYEKVQNADSITLCETYIKNFPHGAHINKIKQKMEIIEFNSCSSLKDYKRFVNKYTSGKYYMKAKDIIDDKKNNIAFIIACIIFFLLYVSYVIYMSINKGFSISFLILGGIIAFIGTIPVCWLLGLLKKDNI